MIAVFVCGKLVHRRELVKIGLFWSAEDALGRQPSDQGRQDLGDGLVIGFGLGKVVRNHLSGGMQ